MSMATARSTITTSEELLDTIKYNNHHNKKQELWEYIVSIYYTSYFTLHRTQKI